VPRCIVYGVGAWLRIDADGWAAVSRVGGRVLDGDEADHGAGVCDDAGAKERAVVNLGTGTGFCLCTPSPNGVGTSFLAADERASSGKGLSSSTVEVRKKRVRGVCDQTYVS